MPTKRKRGRPPGSKNAAGISGEGEGKQGGKDVAVGVITPTMPPNG